MKSFARKKKSMSAQLTSLRKRLHQKDRKKQNGGIKGTSIRSILRDKKKIRLSTDAKPSFRAKRVRDKPAGGKEKRR